MLELFTFMGNTIWGMAVISCGWQAGGAPPAMPPTAAQPVYLECVAEFESGERYELMGQLYRIDRGKSKDASPPLQGLQGDLL